jgi:hypothetical protein
MKKLKYKEFVKRVCKREIPWCALYSDVEPNKCVFYNLEYKENCSDDFEILQGEIFEWED